MTTAPDLADPLVTNADIEQRVDHLVTRAIRDQFWFLLLDADHRQLPTIIPVDRPSAPEPVPEPMWDALADLGHELVVVYERCGPVGLSATDVTWLRHVVAGAAQHAILLRGPVLVHDTGVRWVSPDDLT